MPRSILNAKVIKDLKVTGMLLDNNNHACDCPNTYHVSGAGATEVRMFVLNASMLLIDSSTAQVVYAPASSDTVSPIQQSVDPSMVLGARSSSGNNKGYIYIGPNLVPPGWKLTKYQVNWSLQNNHSSTESPQPSLWSGQTGFYSRKIKNNNGNLIGTYVQEHFKSGATDGTNVLNTLEDASNTLYPWMPSTTDPSYAVIWNAINSTSGSHPVFTGGFCHIERVS
jgi:hypothetical protein